MLQYFIPSKLFLLIVLVFSFQSNHYGQITTTIDFEIAGNGYTPSSTEGSGWTDVFNRTNHNMTIVSNEDGYYWACEDLLALSDPSIDLDQIDISGAISFTFAVDLLAKHIDDWDASDELLITYSVDGASYQNLMWVQSMAGDGIQYTCWIRPCIRWRWRLWSCNYITVKVLRNGVRFWLYCFII